MADSYIASPEARFKRTSTGVMRSQDAVRASPPAFGLAWLALILGVAALTRASAGLSLSRSSPRTTPPPGAAGGLLNAITGSIVIIIGAGRRHRHADRRPGRHLPRRVRPLHDKLSSVVRFINDILLSGAVDRDRPVRLRDHGASRWATSRRWAGAVALAVIVIPVVVRTTEDMLNLVPDALREAGASIGLPRALSDHPSIAYRAAPHRHRHRHAAGHRPHQRRDGTSAVHGAEQPVLVSVNHERSRCPACRWSSSSSPSQPLRGVAEARLDRCAPDHRRPCWRSASLPASLDCRRGQVVMMHCSHNGHGLTIAVPVASHAKVDTSVSPRRSRSRTSSSSTATAGRSRASALSLYAKRRRHGLHRPVGLRQVDAAARAEPHVRPLSQARRADRRGDASTVDNLLRAVRRTSTSCAPRIGMVFQKPTPFPMSIYENIAFGIRLYEKTCPRPRSMARVESGAAAGPRCGTRSRTSSTPTARACRAASSSGLCIARTVAVKPEVILFDEPCLGARSDLDRQDRGADRRAASRTTRSSSSPTTCSRPRASRSFTAFMYLGRADRVRGDGERSSRRLARTVGPRPTSPAASADHTQTRTRIMAEHTLTAFRRRARSG